jgi:hypothetical protein
MKGEGVGCELQGSYTLPPRDSIRACGPSLVVGSQEACLPSHKRMGGMQAWQWLPPYVGARTGLGNFSHDYP